LNPRIEISIPSPGRNHQPGATPLTKAHIDAGQYREIHELADQHQMAIFALWGRSGEPVGAIRELASPNEPRVMRAFKMLPQNITVGSFRWVDQMQANVGGDDWISVIQHLGNVDRPKAARWLRDYLDRHIASGRPSRNDFAPIQAPAARNGAAR
jgi:hypothetical protein